MSFFSTLAAAIWVDAASVNKASVRAWGLVVQNFIDGNAWQSVVKQSDQSKTSDASLADDSELTLALAANTKYIIEVDIYFSTASTPDIKFRHTGPASPTIVHLERWHIVGGGSAFAGVTVDTAYSASDIAIDGSGAAGVLHIRGVIHNGANAGTFAIQWAQNTSNGTAATVRAGSQIRYRKVTP